MSDAAAWQDMGTLRDEHFKDVQAWSQQYGSDPSSAAAQPALAKLRTEHWNDMRALLKKYGASSANSGTGSGMMGGGSGTGYRGTMGDDYASGSGMMGTY